MRKLGSALLLFWTIQVYQNHLHSQCRTQSIFGDSIYSCYCKLRLVTPPPPPWLGLRGQKILILITLDRWKRHFREKNYIENYFSLLESTKSSKTTSQNVEEILFGRIFWTPIPHKWVCRWSFQRLVSPKRSYIPKQIFSFHLLTCSSICDLLSDTRR